MLTTTPTVTCFPGDRVNIVKHRQTGFDNVIFRFLILTMFDRVSLSNNDMIFTNLTMFHGVEPVTSLVILIV